MERAQYEAGMILPTRQSYRVQNVYEDNVCSHSETS